MPSSVGRSLSSRHDRGRVDGGAADGDVARHAPSGDAFRPRLGYQLKIDLEAATSDIWAINVGQVYSTLSRLERDRLVVSTGSDRQGRIVYEITDAGREAVSEWMAAPVDLAVAGRDEMTPQVDGCSRHRTGCPSHGRSPARGDDGHAPGLHRLKAADEDGDLA